MPAKRARRSRFDGIPGTSWKTIAGVVGLLTVITWSYSRVSQIATKTDISDLSNAFKGNLSDVKSQIGDHEQRIRKLEIEWATFFGKQQSSMALPSAWSMCDDYTSTDGGLLTVQYPLSEAMQSAAPRRVPVVPLWFIKQYGLEPFHGGSYAVLGEDGKFYSVDDVLAVMIRSVHLLTPMQQRELRK